MKNSVGHHVCVKLLFEIHQKLFKVAAPRQQALQRSPVVVNLRQATISLEIGTYGAEYYVQASTAMRLYLQAYARLSS